MIVYSIIQGAWASSDGDQGAGTARIYTPSSPLVPRFPHAHIMAKAQRISTNA